MKIFVIILFYTILITGCEAKKTNNTIGSSLESSSSEASEIDITLDPESYNLVLFESKETILQSFKEKIEQEESLALSNDDEMSTGEAALVATISAGFAAGIAGILGSLARTKVKNTPKLEAKKLELPSLRSKWELPSSLLSSTKKIEVPSSLGRSLGLKEVEVSEKKLAEATVDQLESGKSLSFDSRSSAENLEKFLLAEFPSPTREMDVIEVNGKFHLVGWNTELKLESSPLITVELSTKPFSMDNAATLAKDAKEKDFIFLVDPSDSASIKAIDTFKKSSHNTEVYVKKQAGQTQGGKDIYIFSNRSLQERLSALQKVVESKEKVKLEDLNPTRFKGVLDDVISTRNNQMTSLDNLTKSLLEYLDINEAKLTKELREQLEELAYKSQGLQHSLSKNVRALNPDNVTKFLPTDGSSVTLKQENIELFQQHFLDPILLKKYRDFTLLTEELKGLFGKTNSQGRVEKTSLGEEISIIHRSLQEGSPTKRDSRGNVLISDFETDLPAAGVQALPRLALPLGELPKGNSWAEQALDATRSFASYVDKELG